MDKCDQSDIALTGHFSVFWAADLAPRILLVTSTAAVNAQARSGADTAAISSTVGQGEVWMDRSRPPSVARRHDQASSVT